jgi:hypothetical protein
MYYSITDVRIYEAIKLLRDVQLDQIKKLSLLARIST